MTCHRFGKNTKAPTSWRTPRWRLLIKPMRIKLQPCLLVIVVFSAQAVAQQRRVFEGATLILPSAKLRFTRALRLHSLFYEIGRTRIYPTKQQFSTPASGVPASGWTKTVEMPDGRKITVAVTRDQDNFNVTFKAQPDADIGKWGISIDSTPQEYYTGLMERVVDGPQAKSWATGIQEAMNLRGQKGGHDRQAHDVSLCAVLLVVAWVRSLC